MRRRTLMLSLPLFAFFGCKTTTTPDAGAPAKARPSNVVEAEDTVIRAINDWKQQLVPLAKRVRADQRFKGDTRLGPMYAEASESINQFIEAYVAELQRPSANLENVTASAAQVDDRVRAFVEYADRSSTAAIDWVAYAPLIGKAFKAVYDWYVAASERKRQERTAQKAAHIASVQSRKLETDIEKA